MQNLEYKKITIKLFVSDLWPKNLFLVSMQQDSSLGKAAPLSISNKGDPHKGEDLNDVGGWV